MVTGTSQWPLFFDEARFDNLSVVINMLLDCWNCDGWIGVCDVNLGDIYAVTSRFILKNMKDIAMIRSVSLSVSIPNVRTLVDFPTVLVITIEIHVADPLKSSARSFAHPPLNLGILLSAGS